MAFSIDLEQLDTLIATAKKELRAQNPSYTADFAEMTQSLEKEIDEIVTLRDSGQPVVPEIDFKTLVSKGVSDEQRGLIRKRGCVVIRNTFERSQAEEWNEQVAEYVIENGYYETPDKGLDKYFSSLQAKKPQILSVYWSQPQVQARQHENLALARRFLNRLWDYEFDGGKAFDPDRECTYADRVRRRMPGDDSLGLKPHVDGGSVERWLDNEGFTKVYRHLLDGNWQQFNPFEARYRIETNEIRGPAVCSMFRTFQGWTALTEQGPGDGTLELIPSSRVVGWMIMRALQDDVPDELLCGALPRRALQCVPEWHELALRGLCSIPNMNPGDTVWWHPDVIHGVEDQHSGDGYSNVIYIGAAPYCEKNVAYLKQQGENFLVGKSAPDFAAENYEIDYQGRAGFDSLTELGSRQMGFEDWGVG